MAEDLLAIPEPAEAPDARRDMLVQQLEAAVQAPAPDAPAEAPAPARARDETGKFAAKTAEPAPVPGDVIEPAWSKAPSSWKAEKRALWDAFTPEAKEYAFQREEEMRTGVQPLLAKAQFADKMQTVMEPYMATIRGLGAEPEQAVKALMEADHVLRTAQPQQKRDYFMQLARQYGVQLGDVAHLPANQQPDPLVWNLQNELTTLKGTVLSWQQQQEQAQNAQLQTEITSFAAKTENFEDAKPVMIQLLQSGMASTLDEAYAKAIRLDPDLFAKSQAASQAQAAGEKNTAAKAARAAAVSPKSATPGGIAAPKTTDRRSMLEESFSAIEGRL